MTTRTAQQRRVIELALNAAGADDDCEAFAVIRALASDLAEAERKLATMGGLAAEAWPLSADRTWQP